MSDWRLLTRVHEQEICDGIQTLSHGFKAGPVVVASQEQSRNSFDRYAAKWIAARHLCNSGDQPLFTWKPTKGARVGVHGLKWAAAKALFKKILCR
jgi:hypothetical protein